MTLKGTVFAVTILLGLLQPNSVVGCKREPRQLPHGAKRAGDHGYHIYIGDDPNGYEPGKIYNVFLLGPQNQHSAFTSFMLNARSASTADKETARFSVASPKRVGRFQLFDDALTQFNFDCVNTVSEVDNTPKTEIQVMWVAPVTGSGCVALSAMVYENRNSWFADEGNLTYVICEGAPAREGSENECCACDEAKYNFIFEGIWSNETHPRDYPFAIWLTHFSDVIGASHDGNFSFWGENHIATDGFRSLAEWGSPRALEVELRAKGPRLRTLIKAAGLWYPYVNTNTSSNFRVDRKHHKLSLVSMFGPSPDWVVGISGYNLCQTDCTWKDSIDFDLYPWDAGTDNGITYMSPNSETQPRERMYRITTMYPEDPRQPFYNPNAKEMTPLARLYIRRTKTIARSCDEEFLESQILDVSENTEEGATRPECEVTNYNEWTPCSVTCGKGIRMRSRQYVNEALAASSACNRQLVSKEMCVADIPECDGQEDDEDGEENLAKTSANVNDQGEGIGVCRTTAWSDWSQCSATCGIGISMRTRTFIEHAGRKKCPHITIVEKEKCMRPECLATEIEIPDPMCPVTIWSDWSPCSTTCGRGVRIRTRLLLVEEAKKAECSTRLELHQQEQCTQKASCVYDRAEAAEICAQPADAGPCRGLYGRFAYNSSERRCISFVFGGCRGNQNNFLSAADCEETCQRADITPATVQSVAFRQPEAAASVTSTARPIVSRLTTILPALQGFNEDDAPVDCVLSPWSEWSACSVSCGVGFSDRQRTVIVGPRNGGAACLRRFKRRRCEIKC